MSPKNLLKWLTNFTLLAVFIATFFLDLTGVSLHQWLGLAAGAIALFHLVNHWQWLKAITQRFFQDAGNSARFNYLLDAALGLGMEMIILSGLLISTWLELSGSAFEVICYLHVLTSIITLIILFIKLALHWKCIAGAIKMSFTRKPNPSFQTLPTLKCENPAAISRREALRTLGSISLAGGFVLVKTITSLNIPGFEEDLQSGQTQSAIPSPDEYTSPANNVQPADPAPSATAVPFQNQATSNCVVLCSNACLYPGRCRRYIDRNNNGKCDLGECL